MAGRQEGRRRFFLSLALALALIAGGVWMVAEALGRYESIVLSDLDRELQTLARAVDRGISGVLGGYGGDLERALADPELRAAERAYLAGGSGEDLRSVLTAELLPGGGLVSEVLCLEEGRTLLSGGGRTDYVFPAGAVPDGTAAVLPCAGGDGTVFLALLRPGEGGLEYALLLDAARFYHEVAGGLTTGSGDQILLLDAGGRLLLQPGADGPEASWTAGGDPDGCGASAPALLRRAQESGRAGASFVQGPACRGREDYTARLAALPAAGNNGVFTVGVSVDYDALSRPGRASALGMALHGGMVIAGVLLLSALCVQAGRRNERAQRELRLLQEKNAAMEDLTRRTRELSHHQRLETIGTLTSGIAHEFSNLLTPIMGYSILALERLPPEEEVYENILEIYHASRKAKEIIARLSDLSRKNTALSFQYVSPDELSEKVLAVAAPARPARVEVRTELSCRHLWLHGNETQLSQALLNLVLNAYQAMEPDGGVLTVSTFPDGAWLSVRVADTGPGISPEALPHIFDPFFTTKERGRGTGLGLTIVQQVVEEHKGELTVDTGPGRGTAVTLRFPTMPQGEA